MVTDLAPVGIVLAAAVNVGLGNYWFSVIYPELYSKITKQKIETYTYTVRQHGYAFFASLMTAALFFALIQGFSVQPGSFSNFVFLVGLAWFWFLCPLSFQTYVFQHQDMRLWLFDAAYALISLIVIATIVSFFVPSPTFIIN